MAFTTFLMIVSMVAIASAGFPRWPANDPFPGFPSPMISPLRFGSLPPSLPGIPTFPQSFPFFNFPVFPTMPTFPPIPSVADIASGVPTNGGTFTGVVISSKSEAKRKEDGTIVKESGSTILTNTDGVITVKQTGSNPPEIPTNAPPFDFNDPKIKPSNPNQFKNFNNFKHEDFDNFGFGHKFAAIDPKMIEDYVPGEGETFQGKSVRIHTFSSNDNGKLSEEGSSTKIENDNGRVNKEKVAYNSDGTQS